MISGVCEEWSSPAGGSRRRWSVHLGGLQVDAHLDQLVTGPVERRRHRGIDRICGRGNSSSSIPDMESGDVLKDLVYVTVAAVLW